MLKKFSRKSGFTLIELLIVVAIIGILLTISLVILSSSRMSARDAKRVADITSVIQALELYFLNNATYPALISAGQSISDSLETYMSSVPANPTPRNDGGCPNNDYSYVYSGLSNSFAIGYCLGHGVASLISGLHVATIEAITQSGLIGWWKFDEGSGTQIIDSSGELAGTLHGATWEENCRLGPCLAFNGVNSYVELAHLTPQASKTIVAWVYFNNVSNNHQAIFGDGLVQLNANEKLAYKDPSLGYVFSTGSITANTWTNIALVFNSTNSKLYFYINGQPSGEATVSSFSVVTDDIGAHRPGSGNSIFPLDGKLDDVRLYNRVLPDVEIQALYNASRL